MLGSAEQAFNRRAFLAAGGGALGAAAFAGGAWRSTRAEAARQGRRSPNVVIVLADDLGYGALGSFGNKEIRTPVLDRLAAQGVRYTDFYAGAAVCGPSRCTMLTGMHAGHATVRQNPERGQVEDFPLNPDEVTFAHLLQAQGYKTALFGKWGFSPDSAGHFSHPNPQGFQEFYGYLTHIHAHQYYPSYLWHNQTKVDVPGNQGGARGTYAPDFFNQLALDYIEENRDHPFLLFLSTNIPHSPQQVPDLGEYATKPWGAGEKAHAAQITRMDGHVGQVVAKLEELGIADDTVLLFLSDNGPHEEGDPSLNPDVPLDLNGPLRGYKRNLYDGGIRTPAIVWAPGYTGTISGSEVSDPLGFWDVLPTLADLAGAPVPPFVDGGSIRHTFDASATHEYRRPLPERNLYWWRLDPWPSPRADAEEQGRVLHAAEAARKGRWKAVRIAPGRDRTAPDAQWDFQLYDLSADIGERTNLAAQQPEIAAMMLAAIKDSWTDPALPRPKWSVSGLVIDPPQTLLAGGTTPVTVRFDNHTDRPYTRVELAVMAPQGWSVTVPRRSRAAIRPGQSREFVIDVTVPAAARGAQQLVATAAYLYDGCDARTARTTASVTAGVPTAELRRIPTAGWTFTASSSTDLSGNGRGGRPQHAFDGDSETFWHSQWKSATAEPDHAPPPHWIQADAPAATTVAQVRFIARGDHELPRTLYIKTSNDGTDWTTVATETYAAGGSANQTPQVVNFRPTSAKFVRLETGADGTHEASQGHFVVREIEFWR
ncbi:sulfatase-like hydrolase/transferase [Tessaracoccus massiliensis]|uniref:sulfatase-like hydrolase/transferase n=1 Tax=Tessaracoccus massiliensis TaxID=1522311 RepID=UPI0006940159|nr:sulfatase-like hydrolase/transferase [Tessaracoccus massiliensis]